MEDYEDACDWMDDDHLDMDEYNRELYADCDHNDGWGEEEPDAPTDEEVFDSLDEMAAARSRVSSEDSDGIE